MDCAFSVVRSGDMVTNVLHNVVCGRLRVPCYDLVPAGAVAVALHYTIFMLIRIDLFSFAK